MSAAIDAAAGDPFYTQSVFTPAMITPQAVQSQAASWADVLKFGLGRIVDYKIATVQPVQPAVVATDSAVRVAATRATGTSNMVTWLLIGAAALIVLPKLIKD